MKINNNINKIFMLAGETSSDQIGSSLMIGLKDSLNSNVKFFGVGGSLMQKQGLVSAFDIKHLNIIGFTNTILNYKNLKKKLNDIIELIIIEQPKVVITIDSKGFSLALAKALKKKFKDTSFKCPLIHFVPPTIWAYGKSRAKKWIDIHDGLFCIFNKEIDIFKKYNIECLYVGNPILEKSLKNIYNIKNITDFKTKYSLKPENKICLILPGSRDAEINYILPEFLNTIELSKLRWPNLIWFLPTTKKQFVKVKNILDSKKKLKNIHIIILEDHYDILNISDLALACSGTVTLELVLFNIPTIAVYKSDWLSAFIGKKLVDFKNVILPNFLANKEIVPFLFQDKCNANTLTLLLNDFLIILEKKQKEIKNESSRILKSMGYDKHNYTYFSKESSNKILSIINNFNY